MITPTRLSTGEWIVVAFFSITLGWIPVLAVREIVKFVLLTCFGACA